MSEQCETEPITELYKCLNCGYRIENPNPCHRYGVHFMCPFCGEQMSRKW